MLDILHQIEIKILILINQTLKSDILDFFFPYFTNIQKIPWVIYFLMPSVLVLWLLISKKKFISIFLATFLTIGISDLLSYKIIKNNFHRIRPNNNVELAQKLRVLRGPKSSSFPSNHSMNSFAAATTLVYYYPVAAIPLYAIAGIVGFFRLYAGVHYPSDVIGGAILGVLLALFLRAFVFSKISFFRKS